MGLLIKDLRKGDRVVISRSSYYYDKNSYNPPDSVQGTIKDDNTGSVRWDNGTSNGYRDGDLILVSDMYKTQSSSSELTKTPIAGKWYTNPEWSKGSIAKAGSSSGDNFYYSECIYLGDSKTKKGDSQWLMYDGVKLATDEELSKYLPDDHIDNPTRILKDSKRGTPIGTYTPKKGDKVKVVANRSYSGISIGDIAIVESVYSDHCYLKIEGKSSVYNYFDDLELVPKEPYKPKEGDTVRIIANRSDSANKIGEIGIVGSITGIHCIVKVPGTSRGGITHYFDDLELVSSKSSTTFKSGDKVRIISNISMHGFAIGDIGYLKGFRNTSISGGYYWNVDVIDRKILSNNVRECDMVKVDPSEISKPLPPVDRRAYSTKSVYKDGEKVTVRLIKDLSFEVSNIKDIPIGTYMICDGGYFTGLPNINSLHPNNNKYGYNFPRGWFEVLGIHERDMPKSKTPILYPITSFPKVWRVKTKAEMVADGTIYSSQRRPRAWSSEGKMDKYFGTTIDPRHYSSIEKVSDTDLYNWIDRWWFCKNELTTKPLPFGTVSVEDDDSDDERDSISWESDVAGGSYDYDLDKLDEMSKDDIKETRFEKSIEAWPDMGSPSIYSKRPKTEVVIIPQRKRMIY